MTKELTLWVDETIYLDNASSGSYASTWVLPPEKYLALGNAVQAQFAVEYRAYGPSVTGSNVSVAFDQTSAMSDDDDAFEALSASANPVVLTRTFDTAARVFGEDGAQADSYPRGMARVKLSNTDSTASAWAAVKLRIWVRLADSPDAAASVVGGRRGPMRR